MNSSGHLIGGYWLLEQSLECLTWFARVPSSSNPADGPSRGDFSLMERLGAARCKAVLPESWNTASYRAPNMSIFASHPGERRGSE